jgi:hypothetical protein
MNKSAIVVTDRRILPIQAGNHARILGLLRGLRALGWRVSLIAPHENESTEIGREVEHFFPLRAPSFSSGDVNRFDFRPYRRAVEYVAEKIKPAVAVAEYAWLAPALRGLPRPILRIVDCHDVLHERTRRFTDAQLDPWVQCTVAQEHRLLKSADILLAIQQREAAVLQRLLPTLQVHCLLPYVDAGSNLDTTHMARPVVLAVGADHPGNAGIRTFAADIWPTLFPHRSDVLLRVIGSIARGIPPRPRVELTPYTENLSECYRTAAVVVCPIEVGTGVKIKLLEALRFGKAIVATPAAVEGLLPPTRAAWILTDSLVECGKAVQVLIESPLQRTIMSEGAFAYGEQYLSQTRFLSDLKKILPSTIKRIFRRLA